MQYLLLINDEESVWESLAESDRNAMYAEYGRYTEELRSRGLLVDANQLQPTSTATTVSVRDGETIVTDGPFAETKEALGGFYLIEARDLDHAIEIARLCPAPFGGVEVRPIMDTSGG
jgi:hypothetical protein